MSQNRVFWAVRYVGFAPLGETVFTPAYGVQSAGVNTTYNLTPVFQLGQSRIYENIEEIPDVEVTMEKVLDGFPLLYHLATRDTTGPDLFARSNSRCTVGMSIFPDTNQSAWGAPISTMIMSGLYVSASSFTFPVDGNFTESITLVGNDTVWELPNNTTFSGVFDNTARPLALTQDSGGIQRRENLLFGLNHAFGPLDINGQVNATVANPTTVLPRDIAGISASGTNNLIPGTNNYLCSIQNISVSTTLGREAINELGHKAPYYRFMSLPVEVTTEIEAISKSGDWLSVSEEGVLPGGFNTYVNTIKIATEDGLFIDLGTENRLSAKNLTGADTDGGNQTMSFTYTTYNEYTVYHHQDVSGL
jgi:hypothetical protein